MDTHQKVMGRKPSPNSLTRPFHLRVTAETEEHIVKMAQAWAVNRQTAVRRILKQHMQKLPPQ